MKRRRIGIMLELNWPYRRHVDVFAGTQRYAREVGDWDCEIDEFHADQRPDASRLAGYDGILGRVKVELAELAEQVDVPLVNVWFSSPARDKLSGVFPDFAAIGSDAAAHLLERGFRQFGCLSRPREPAHQMMVAAFHREVRERGYPCQCAKALRFYYRNGKNWDSFQEQLDNWIRSWSPPIALFVAFNDVTIRYVVNACRRHGLRVPEDVALISATNEPVIGEMPPPSISSVEVNYEQIGYRAAQMLDCQMKRGDVTQEHVHLLPSGVIARDSTDFFAVDDELVAAAMRYIEKNLSKEIDVGIVAKSIGASRRTLERRFRESAGRSIAREIRRLRLMKARRLLLETELLVKQVAQETGFRDAARLHEAFVRTEGVSPSEFRRISRGDGG